jgi:hypothetical protein
MIVQREPTLRTLLVIVIGIAMLFAVIAIVSALNKGRSGKPIDGATTFVWLWLVFAITDCYVGVNAGHDLGLELAIHALIFAVPVGLAWYLWRRSRARRPSESGPQPK